MFGGQKTILEKKVTVFGSYSGYNKGDLAILLSIIDNLLQNVKNYTLFIPSKKPTDLKEILPNFEENNVIIFKTITAYWGIQTLQIIRSSDLLIFGGGGLFFDKKPYNLFYNHIVNLFLITLANKLFFKKPIYLFSVGSSHLRSKIMISLTKYILKNSSCITARDYHTVDLFSRYSQKNIGLYYDPAFLIGGDSKISIYMENFIKKLDGNNKIIISFNESFLNQIRNNSKMQEMVNVINILQEKYKVVLTYNTTKSKHINKLYDLCEKNNLEIFHPYNTKPEEIIFLYSIFDFAICVPMHAAIFAYNAGTKMITIEYDDKVKEFNKIIGNTNTVNLNALKRIPWFLEHYNEIDWDKKNNIKENASENFIKLKEIINVFNTN